MNKKTFVKVYGQALETLPPGPGRIEELRRIEGQYLAVAPFKQGQVAYYDDNEFTNVQVRIGEARAYSDGRVQYMIYRVDDPDEPLMVAKSRFDEQHLDEPLTERNLLKAKAERQGLSPNYIVTYRINSTDAEHLSVRPADQYQWIFPMEDTRFDFNREIMAKTGLDQFRERSNPELKISRGHVDKIFTPQFKGLFFELAEHLAGQQPPTGNWSVDHLSTLKGKELKIMAKTLRVPHSGLKSKVAAGIARRISVLKGLQGFENIRENAFGDCDMLYFNPQAQELVDSKKSVELLFLCRTANLMGNTTDYNRALFLLNMKHQIQRGFHQFLEEYTRHVPKTIRQILEGSPEPRHRCSVMEHKDFQVFKAELTYQKKQLERLRESDSPKPGKERTSQAEIIKTRMPIFDHKTAAYMDSLGKKNFKVVVSISFGKDSLATYYEAKANGVPIHSVVFADTGWEFDAIHDMLKQFEEQEGVKVIHLKPKVPFNELLVKYSWPHTQGRWCTERKIANISQYINQIKEPEDVIVECVGYAADEVNRALRMQESGKKEWPAFPLIEAGIIEADALERAFQEGYFWGDSADTGLYSKFDRVSCYCCPLQSAAERAILRDEHPELWERMLEMEKTIVGRPDQIIGFSGTKTLAQIDREMAIFDVTPIADGVLANGASPSGPDLLVTVDDYLESGVKRLDCRA